LVLVKRSESEWTALAQEYQRLVTAHCGVESEVARTVVAEILAVFRAHFGGSEVYVPRPARYDEATVLRDFNGRNHDEVCKAHGIHRATLWRILERDAARRKRAAAATARPAPPSSSSGQSGDFHW
jgi:Mor family transcriptional regulator